VSSTSTTKAPRILCDYSVFVTLFQLYTKLSCEDAHNKYTPAFTEKKSK